MGQKEGVKPMLDRVAEREVGMIEGTGLGKGEGG